MHTHGLAGSPAVERWGGSVSNRGRRHCLPSFGNMQTAAPGLRIASHSQCSRVEPHVVGFFGLGLRTTIPLRRACSSEDAFGVSADDADDEMAPSGDAFDAVS
jgi:hypothetical protein